jgi:hypothetical protein
MQIIQIAYITGMRKALAPTFDNGTLQGIQILNRACDPMNGCSRIGEKMRYRATDAATGSRHDNNLVS